jgi:hypothetical protein
MSFVLCGVSLRVRGLKAPSASLLLPKMLSLHSLPPQQTIIALFVIRSVVVNNCHLDDLLHHQGLWLEAPS